MKFSRESIGRIAEELGFQEFMLEKVLLLMDLLEYIYKDSFLKERLALKGGTALNLFILKLPRLSVDIDLNYIGSTGREITKEIMLEERPIIEQKIQAICSVRKFQVKQIPGNHAGNKYRLTYKSEIGSMGHLELDINFLLRSSLFTPQKSNSQKISEYQVENISVLNIHELVAGKLAALFARHASRDLFDAWQILEQFDNLKIGKEKLRLTFVIYGAMNRTDWRTVTLDDIRFDHNELENRLRSVLRQEYTQAPGNLHDLSRTMQVKVRAGLEFLFPFNDREKEFLTSINDHGEIKPDLLTGDKELIDIIAKHPALKWKAMNVKEYIGH